MKSFKIILAIALLVFMFSCRKKDDDPMDKAFNGTAWLFDQTGEFSIIGIHEDGSIIAIKTDNYDDPVGVVYHEDIDSEGLYVLADQDGYPYAAYSEGVLVLFENYSGNKADVAFIFEDGEIEIETGIEFDIPGALAASGTKSTDNKLSEDQLSEDLRWAGHALSIASCIISIATAPAHAGVLTAIACGFAISSFIIAVSYEDDPALRASEGAFGVIGSGIGCAGKDPVACAALFTSVAGIAVSNYEEAVKENENKIELAHDGLTNPIDDVPGDINEIISEDFVNILEGKGMNIYTGFNPPDVEGNYYMNSLKNWETSTEYIEYTYKFENQSETYEIDIEYTIPDGSSISVANKAYIAGEDNDFSVYAEFRSTHNKGTHIVRITLATILSGTYTAAGITDFQKGFIITSKSNDLNNEYMDVEDYRIVYEVDGLCERVYSYPYNELGIKNMEETLKDNMLRK